MRVPYRKPGKFASMRPDPLMTEAKYNQLKEKLEKLKAARPHAASEVARLAELGDFSENAEYQLAKGKLRGMNNAMLRLEHELNHAEIISPRADAGIVQLGSEVTVECDGKERTYHILGSSETNPGEGVISHNSPIGAALLGHEVGDEVVIKLAKREVIYKIICIV